MKTYTNIKGIVKKVNYYNPDDNWGVLVVTNNINDNIFPHYNSVQLTGYFSNEVRVGSHIVFSGIPTNSKFGVQVNINDLIIDNTQKSMSDIINYIHTKVTPTTSMIVLKNIYKEHSTNTLNFILNNTNEIAKDMFPFEIDRQTFINEVNSYKNTKSISDFCEKYSIPYKNKVMLTNLCDTEIEKYFISNIYKIYNSFEGVSFEQLDKIAQNLGVDLKNKDRLRACLEVSLMRESIFNSSAGATVPSLRMRFNKVAGVSDSITFQATLNKAILEDIIILENNTIYNKDMYYKELDIATKLMSLNKIVPDIYNGTINNVISSFKYTLTNEQKKAISKCCSSQFSILVGPPGSGKTTISKAIVDIFHKAEYNLILLAPTGKATKRLEECTGFSASTIHKFLKVQHSIEDAQIVNIPKRTFVLIDESSMLDSVVFAKFLQSLKKDTVLVLVGDPDQLPSVQAGNILSDLIESNAFNTVRLKDILRQSADSNIIKYCAKINRGEVFDPIILDDFVFKEYADDAMLLKEFQEYYQENLKDTLIKDIQVISPYKNGKLGVQNLNYIIKSTYNRQEKEKFGYSLHDKVMNCTNDYTNNVFNGEIGQVSKINEDSISIKYDHNTVDYKIEDLFKIQLAYASTCHKVQGAEYKVVFVILDNKNDFLLLRKVLNTAVSRGKQKVFILSMPYSTDICIENSTEKERITKLQEFISDNVN